MSRSPSPASNKSMESRNRSRSPRRPAFVPQEIHDKDSQTEVTYNLVEDRFEMYIDPIHDATRYLANIVLFDQDLINTPPRQWICDPRGVFKRPNIKWTKEWTGLKHNGRDNWIFHWAIDPNNRHWYLNIRTRDGTDLWAEYHLLWQTIQTTDNLEDAFRALRVQYDLLPDKEFF